MANETRLMSGSLRLAQLDGAFAGADNTSAIYLNTDGKLHWKVGIADSAKEFISAEDVSGSIMVEAGVRAAADASITTVMSAMQADIDQNESDSDAAETSLTTRLAAEETARAAAITALQADVDANETASDDAEASLTTRVAAEETARAAAITALQADVDANETASDDAEASLSTRLGAEESARAAADTSIGVVMAAMQADIDGNESDSDAAEASLSTRVGAEESARAAADTSLGVVIAALQADVDGNESDSDAAEASLTTRLATEETAAAARAGSLTTRLAAEEAASANLAGGNSFIGDQLLNGDMTLEEEHFVKAGSFVTYSDATLKTNIQTMDDALDKVMSMRGVTYNFKSREDINEVGFLAQEMKQTVPEVVYGNGDGNLGIDYAKITSVLVEAVKAQQAQIEELKDLLKK